MRDPFRSACGIYRQRGWAGTIPLPAGQKFPPPSGWTGRNATFPDDEQIAAWAGMSRYRGGNLAIHLGFPVVVDGERFEVVGLDVDAYGAKRGGEQLTQLEAEHGPLPETYVSSARVDGVSGIRFYLVPVGLDFVGKAAPAIEVVQKKHRYAVVWPSMNPDTATQYRWTDPAGLLLVDEVPEVADLPGLPDAWVEFLTGGLTPDIDMPVDTASTPEELLAWTETAFGGQPDDAPCERMRRATDLWVARIEDEESSHDKITGADWNLANLALEGHTGWRAARAEVVEVYIASTLRRGKRGVDDLRGEVGRSVVGTLRKLRAVAAGDYLAPTCPCPPLVGSPEAQMVNAALGPGGVWHQAQPEPRRYRRAWRPRYQPAYRAKGGVRRGR